MTNRKKPLDLDEFYRSRLEIAGEIGTVYAQRQVAGIRQAVQEKKLEQVAKATNVQKKQEDK